MSILTLSGVQTTNAGTYEVIVSRTHFTNSATLTVNSTPTPASIQSVSPSLTNSFDAYIGQTLALSVQASGFSGSANNEHKDINPSLTTIDQQ